MTAMTIDSTQQRLIARLIETDEDWRRVRALLIDTYPITPVDFNWDVRHWDGWRYHRADDSEYQELKAGIRLWKTADGRLVGVAHPEYRGEVYLELHPDYRYVEVDMIAWAEQHLSVPTEDGQQRQLDIFVLGYDVLRQRLLEQRGYQKLSWSGVSRRLRLGNWPLPPVPVLPDGYTLRTTHPCDEDYQRVADALNAGFERTCHTGPEIRRFMTEAPCFRHDLDLVAEAPDGVFAAYVGVTFEPVNRYGIFEPVCTHPDHRRKGLAQALMIEGLHRLKALNAVYVSVWTGDAVPANRLYESIGFTEAYMGYPWRKVF